MDGFTHLFHRLARVDGDDAVGSLDEALIRKSIANEVPHSGADLVEGLGDTIGLADVVAVRALAPRQGDGQVVVGFETTGTKLGHPARVRQGSDGC